MTSRLHGSLALAMLLALTAPAMAQQPGDEASGSGKPTAAAATPATDPPKPLTK